MKKVLAGLAAGAMMFGATALPVLAAGSSGSQASYCGVTHGAFADVNGNFGFLGEVGGTPGYHDAVGQQAGATGYNNSSVDCTP